MSAAARRTAVPLRRPPATAAVTTPPARATSTISGGWRPHGRGNDGHHGHSGARHRYIHSAPDDRTRLIYSKIHTDERAVTAAEFWRRATAWFSGLGISCERVLTDNSPCYRSGPWHQASAATGTTPNKTRPRPPQTNGKIDRYHRIPLEERAHIHPWTPRDRTPSRPPRLRPLPQTPPTPQRPRLATPPPPSPTSETSPQSTTRGLILVASSR